MQQGAIGIDIRMIELQLSPVAANARDLGLEDMDFGDAVGAHLEGDLHRRIGGQCRQRAILGHDKYA